MAFDLMNPGDEHNLKDLLSVSERDRPSLLVS
jgi:hypothetical protein